jgi:hypothetical protein
MESGVLGRIGQSSARWVRIADSTLKVLVVLLGGGLGRVADSCLFGDACLEDAAEVGYAQEQDHEQWQDESELDQRLAAL